MNKDKIKNIIFILLSGVMVVLRIILQMMVPLYPIVYGDVDDMLMVNFATKMSLKKPWLGEYDTFTLNKLPGYALFLKLNNILQLRYTFFLGFVYCAACVLFLYVMYKFTKSRLNAFIAFVIVLFCPVMLDSAVGGRIYCISLVPPCTIAIISAYIGIIADRDKIKKFSIWLVIAGLVYSYYRFMRYAYIWLTCFIIGVTILLVILYILDNKKDLSIKKVMLRLLVFLIPMFMGVLTTNTMKLANYRSYGVYITSDFNESNFAKMCKLLMSIEQDEEVEGVYVTMDVIRKAAEVSPNLKKLCDERDSAGWVQQLDDGNIFIEFYAWNLRWAAENYDMYVDAKSVNEFYGQICTDLEKAFDNGILKKRKVLAISPFSTPMTFSDIPKLIDYSVNVGLYNVVFCNCLIVNYHVTEAPSVNERVRVFEDLINEELISPDELGKALLSGWIYAENPEEELSLSLYDDSGNEYFAEFTDSFDVYNTHNVECAKKARFRLVPQGEWGQNDTAYIRIKLDDKIVYDAPFDEFTNGLDIEGCNYVIDEAIYPQWKENVAAKEKKINKDMKFLRSFINVIQKSALFILLLCVITCVLELGLDIYEAVKKKKPDFLPFVLKLGLFFTMWINVMMQAERNFKGGAPFNVFYSAGAYVIYSIFIAFCMAEIIGLIGRLYNRLSKKFLRGRK